MKRPNTLGGMNEFDYICSRIDDELIAGGEKRYPLMGLLIVAVAAAISLGGLAVLAYIQ